MKFEIINNKELEKEEGKIKIKEEKEIFYKKPVNKEEQKNNILKIFKDLTKREMTEQEFNDYISLFERGEENLFTYIKNRLNITTI